MHGLHSTRRPDVALTTRRDWERCFTPADYESALERIAELAKADPSPESEEGRKLLRLVNAAEEYEKWLGLKQEKNDVKANAVDVVWSWLGQRFGR